MTDDEKEARALLGEIVALLGDDRMAELLGPMKSAAGSPPNAPRRKQRCVNLFLQPDETRALIAAAAEDGRIRAELEMLLAEVAVGLVYTPRPLILVFASPTAAAVLVEVFQQRLPDARCLPGVVERLAKVLGAAKKEAPERIAPEG